MMKENHASVKDMEAAAVAWVCNLSSTPMFCVKVCSDLVDRGDEEATGEEEFQNNIHAVSGILELN